MAEPRREGDREGDERIEVGRIVKPHGIRGEVVVAPTSDRPERFAPGAVLHGGGRTFLVRRSRPHQGRLLVLFEEVDDRGPAERLRGTVLEAPRDALDEDEVYRVDELVGLTVLGPEGARLGAVEALIELPAAAGYDLLEVRRDDGGTWLLPAAEELVALEEADEGLRLIVHELPEGLVDDERRDEAGA